MQVMPFTKPSFFIITIGLSHVNKKVYKGKPKPIKVVKRNIVDAYLRIYHFGGTVDRK